jgi:hypothetical protein
MTPQAWPPLALEDWVDTQETFHLWTQMVGKVKLDLCPFINQWWEVALSLTARGLSSGLIPTGERSFQIDFDLIDHRLLILTSDGEERSLELAPQTVADFYGEFMEALSELGISVVINPLPSEITDPVPFTEDTAHQSYDAEAIGRWWRAMLSVERVIERFRTGFTGKSSPVLFFWGGFDLNHTRFNGRAVPQPADLNPMMRFGENEENFSVGFWPGGRESPHAVLYAYHSPAPDGLAGVTLGPPQASYMEAVGEFILPYDVARQAQDPDAIALEFFRSAYEGAAELAGWDRAALEGPVPDGRGSR